MTLAFDMTTFEMECRASWVGSRLLRRKVSHGPTSRHATQVKTSEETGLGHMGPRRRGRPSAKPKGSENPRVVMQF